MTVFVPSSAPAARDSAHGMPASQASGQDAPPGLNYPGNSKIAAADLPGKWTGTFTPVFDDTARFAEWRQRTGCQLGIG